MEPSPVRDGTQPPPARSSNTTQLACRRNHLITPNCQQPLVGRCPPRMRSNALRTAQHNAARPIRPVTRRVRGSKDRHHRNLQRRRQMHRPRVASNKQSRPPRQRNQFCDRKTHPPSRPSARRLGRAHQLFFSRTIIEDRTNPLLRQPPRNLAVAFRRPSLRTPTRPRIQNGKVAYAQFRKPLLNPRLSLWIARQFRWQPARSKSSQPLGHRKILLDNVPAARHNSPRIPKAGRRLSRFRNSVHRACPRPPRQHGRSNRALQIHGNVVPRIPHIVPNPGGVLQRRYGEPRLPPLFQIHGVDFIHQRPQHRPRAPTRRSRRAQQFRPALFDQPADERLRKYLPQEVNRGQSVDHISHGAEPHDQPPLNLRLWHDIKTIRPKPHARLGDSRERMISLVELSLRSPTTATPPPYSPTT